MDPKESLKTADSRVVGKKETTKALQNDNVQTLFVADNAEPFITEDLIKLGKEKSVDIVRLDTMDELGKACGIDIGSSCAAILKR